MSKGFRLRGDIDLAALLQHSHVRINGQVAVRAPARPGNAEAALLSKPGANKFGNVKTDGFASKKEAKRYGQLRTMERAGVVRNLDTQVPFLLLPKHKDGERALKYIADFVYEEVNHAGEWLRVVEDAKGFRTAAYVIKRKLMLFFHNIKLRET